MARSGIAGEARKGPFVIGITGGIGCGKSTVAGMLRELGIEVLDADAISRALTQAGGAAVDEVLETFGEELRDADGGIDRPRLSSIVFRDKNAIDRLSGIIHRYVIAALIEGVADAGRRGLAVIALDVPLPVREGFLDLADYVVVVWAEEATRLERLEARGMARDEAQRRMDLQMSEDEYVAIASTVLRNDSTREALRAQVHEVVRQQLHARGIRIALPEAPEASAGAASLGEEPVGPAAHLGDEG